MNKPLSTSRDNLLTSAVSQLGLTKQNLSALKAWLLEQLVSQAYAKLGQGGHTVNQVPLRQVFVDLPIEPEFGLEERQPFLKGFLDGVALELKKAYEFDADESELISSLRELTKIMPIAKRANPFSAVLLIGGPGQGKSTLGQLACQLHRAVLLEPFGADLISSHKELVDSYVSKDARKDKNIRIPKKPRIPLQIPLPEFSSWLSRRPENDQRNQGPALLEYIADLPSARDHGLSAEILLKILSAVPALIVLDGFDEVGATQDRRKLVVAARELLSALARVDGHAQLLATTRPQGYAGELEKIGINLTTLHLVPLRKVEALDYGRRLVDAKIQGVDSRAQAFVKLEEATTEPATERLLTSPLQVTIFVALVQQIGRAPRERWNLFLRFFSYTYEREVERGTYASKLLSTFRPQIERIHARVGLLLQVEGERDGGASVRMPRVRLEEVIDAVLHEDGFSQEQRVELVKEISKAAEQRLVFLVESEPDSFGFDIRSLQEFMAAWALTTGREAEIEARLQQVANASMFRNVFLFMFSRLYSDASPLRELLATRICPNLNSFDIDYASAGTLSGALLALETLEEGAVLTQPRQARTLMECATRLLELPPGNEHLRLARVANEDTAVCLQQALEGIIRNLENYAAFNNMSAWACLIELANRGDPWAKNVGEKYWSTLQYCPALVDVFVSLGIHLTEWLAHRFVEQAGIIAPTSFLGMRISKSDKVTSTWAGWLITTYEMSDEWRKRVPATDVLSISGLERSGRFAPPTSDIPKAWEAWVGAALFEHAPSAISLSNALELLSKSDVDLDFLAWRSAWPLTLAIRSIEERPNLFVIAKRLRKGQLGDIDDWLALEMEWKDHSPTLEETLSGFSELPWSLKTKTIPSLATAWWGLRLRRKGVRAIQSYQLATDEYHATSSPIVRKWIAHFCLYRLDELPRYKKTDPAIPVEEWMKVAPQAVRFLFPKPAAISLQRWRSIIDEAVKSWDRVWYFDYHVALQVPNSSIDHPIVIRLCMQLFADRRHPVEHFTQLLDRVSEIFAARASSLPIREKNWLSIINIYRGQSDALNDKNLVASLVEDQDYLGIRAIINSVTRKDMAARGILILQLLHQRHFAERDIERMLIKRMRELLQRKTSELHHPSTWAKLILPLPAPLDDASCAEEFAPSTDVVAISSISIRGVGGFEKFDLDFAQPRSGCGQWTVLLGSNGVGKSTILRSIALCLRNTADPSIWPRGTFSRRWLAIGKNGEIESEASIAVNLGSNREHRTIIRGGASMQVAQSPELYRNIGFPIFAFGSRRNGGWASITDQGWTVEGGGEIATLFDESESLLNPEQWLIRLDGDSNRNSRSRDIFSAVSAALCDVLEVESIFVRDMEVWVKEIGRQEVPFSCLSDGYLISAGWLLDLLSRWLSYAAESGLQIEEDFMSRMTGLVLIDEIDTHLHPKWQLEIIPRIRKLLPLMSFVVTTHNPLTLVGVSSTEIWTLAVKDGKIVACPGGESPMLLTGGQIYKQYFGVSDLFPKEIGLIFRRFSFLSGYALRTDEEELEVFELLNKLRTMGLAIDWDVVPREDISEKNL
jgi:energy-coupling factor transporter ATP-binding protein EcfA2/SpoVK/Ycf46/Vps4 family AAA+-type ATPase